MKRYRHEQLRVVCLELLKSVGISKVIATEVAQCLVQTSLRGVDSHGIRLLPHYVRVARSGRINRDPNCVFNQTGASTGIFDADHTYGHAAASFAMKEAINMADKAGAGFVVIKNSTHFSASAYYALQASNEDMIGIACTNTSPMMVPTRGKRPFFGTNAITFSFPCHGEEPICLDMATTQIAWNWVLKAREENRKLDFPWGVSSTGSETDDPHSATGLLPAGLHKGYGLGLVVEILCGILSNQTYGPHVSSMFDGDLSNKLHLSHFVGAIKIANFLEIELFKASIKRMVSELRDEPPIDPKLPVLVAGDPEKHSEELRSRDGIPIEDVVVEEIYKMISERGLSRELHLKPI